jgi:hypothetical protein
VLLEQVVRQVLVAEALDDVGVRQQDERVQLITRAREDELVEVRQRHDQLHVVLADELAKDG